MDKKYAMSFPRISTKSTNFTITPQLEVLLDQKFTSLAKFLKEDGDVKCEVELEKIGDQHSGKIFRAEINLFVEGKMLRAESTEDTMESAIDVIRDEITRELKHANEKSHSLMKRGGQAIKNMMRFGK